MRQMAIIVIATTLVVQPVRGQSFQSPAGLAVSPGGQVVVADRGAHRVFSVDPGTGRITVLAGTGKPGFAGDGGPAAEADFRNPEWVAFDGDGNLWIADRGNARIRVIHAASGVVETRVGGAVTGFSGDGGPATAAGLTSPFGVAVGPAGAVYVFDTEAHVIRGVDPRTGQIATVVGTGEAGFNGDGNPGTAVLLRRPHNGTFADDGRLVFGDSFNHLIRIWDPASGEVTTLGGSSTEGVPQEGQRAAVANLNYFGAIVSEQDGSVLFTSITDSRIWRIRADTGQLQVVAGVGEEGLSGDGGSAVDARLAFPYGMALGPDGQLYFADSGNRRIRVVDLTSGIIATVAGG